MMKLGWLVWQFSEDDSPMLVSEQPDSWVYKAVRIAYLTIEE